MGVTYSFEDYIERFNKKVKDLTIDELYSIYEKYSLTFVIDMINKVVIVEPEE
jgi:hypothetical protein